MPDTITRPRACRMISTARTSSWSSRDSNAATAAASIRITRRADSRISEPAPALRSLLIGSDWGPKVRPVLSLDPVAVAPVHHRSPPPLVGEIPGKCLPNPALKVFPGHKAQFPLDLRAINGISPIVPGPVRHKGDELPGRSSLRVRALGKPEDQTWIRGEGLVH